MSNEDSQYIEISDIKASMPDTTWGDTYDEVFEQAASDASRAVDLYLGRDPGAFAADADSVRYFTGSGSIEQWIDELAQAPTEVAVDEIGTRSTYTAWAASDFMLWPYNAIDRNEPILKLEVDQLGGTKSQWYKFPQSVKITGRWGYSIEPPSIVSRATLVQATRFFKRAQQAWQDTGAISELGQLRFVQKLDPEVELLVEHLRRIAI